MVGKLKIRTLLAAGAIALSSQASFAATDTSCNPFARGSNCDGAISVGKSIGQYSFGKRASASRAYRSEGFQTRGRGQRGDARLDSLLGSLATLFNAFESDDAPSFDEPEVILVEETDDVSAVPIPASGALLLIGLGGLVAMRRKKS